MFQKAIIRDDNTRHDIRDIFELFLQDYCALQELLMKMNFTLAVAPPFVHPMTSLPVTPTHSVRKYGFFSEPTPRRQVAKPLPRLPHNLVLE